MYTKLSGIDFEVEVLFSKDLSSLIQETSMFTDIEADQELLLQAQKLIAEILEGEYQNSNGEERLLLQGGHYVKINFASSGQQEAVWILNVLFYYLVNHIDAYFIIEEPESHLYPNIQKLITEYIVLAKSKHNQILVTPHSPYILGTLNNLLYAGEVSERVDKKKLCEIIPSKCWLFADQFMAYYMDDGKPCFCMETEEKQIANEVIDDASVKINEDYDKMVTLKYREERECF